MGADRPRRRAEGGSRQVKQETKKETAFAVSFFSPKRCFYIGRDVFIDFSNETGIMIMRECAPRKGYWIQRCGAAAGRKDPPRVRQRCRRKGTSLRERHCEREDPPRRRGAGRGRARDRAAAVWGGRGDPQAGGLGAARVRRPTPWRITQRRANSPQSRQRMSFAGRSCGSGRFFWRARAARIFIGEELYYEFV